MKKITLYSAAVLIIVIIPGYRLSASSILPASLPSLSAMSHRVTGYSPNVDADVIYDERMKRFYGTFLRVGFAAPSMLYMMDKDLGNYFKESWGLMADCFFYRKRNRRGNGFDIGARFTYRNFTIGKDVLKQHSDLLYRNYRTHMMSWDICFRGVIGTYFLRELWQLYIVAAPRLLHYHSVMKESRIRGPEKTVDLVSIGIIGGAGIEVTLVSFLGIFAEYNIGYTPVGKSYNNVEGHQVYVGLVWRTPGVGITGF